jgi:serine protease Do
MRKSTILIIFLGAALVAFLSQILFGNYLSARLATLPALRNLNLFNPRAPIVVTNKETVRVSDSNDAVETANAIKSKLSVVVYYEGTGSNAQLVLSGGALNWTADGYFVTTVSALAVPNKTYAVILNNGDIFPVKEVFADKASSLVILSTDASNLSTAEPVASNTLRPGEKILMMLNSIPANKTTFLESYMRSFATDVSGQEFSSDADTRSLSVQSVGTLAPGHAAINLNGSLAGMWDGEKMVSSDAIRTFANNFFRDGKQVIRPAFGFSYKQLASNEARALQLVAGAQVTAVAAASPASAGGLQRGDIITTIDGEKLEDEILLSSMLADIAPGKVVTLEVFRNSQTIPVLITAASQQD